MIRFIDDRYGRSPLIAVFILFLLKSMLFRWFVFGGETGSAAFADAVAVLSLLLLVEIVVPARIKGAAYWLLNVIYSLVLFASTIYSDYYGSIPTYTALKALNQLPQIGASVNALIQGVYFLYFADVALIALWYVVRKIRGKRLAGRRRLFKIRWLAAGMLVCVLLSSRFVYTANAIPNELAQAESVGFLNYQAAAAWKAGSAAAALQLGSLEETTSEAMTLQASYPYRDSEGASREFGSAQGKNLIVVQLEAFQNFPLHLTVGGREVTPVLNKLAEASYYFPHIYQQIGQGNTSDAEFMSNTSIYPEGKKAMSSNYGDRELPSLPKLLQSRGYEAVTFHVNDVSFWDRNKLYPALGFDHFYDKPFFENDHFNDFGPSDEQLFKTGIAELSELAKSGKPFYAQFVTASSHFPFHVPDGFEKLELPDELDGTHLGDYLRAVHYADYALGTFIDQLKANGLWDNSVLAVYGDHFGLQPDKAPADKISSLLGITYDDRLSRFNIPFIVHNPDQPTGEVVEQPGGQLDMMPTIANLLGIVPFEEGVVTFGHDLLNIDRNVFGMRYYLPTGSFFNNDILFIPGKGFDDGKAYSLKTMKLISGESLDQYRDDYDYVLKLMEISDLYVKQLPKRGPALD
ncbi:LTA synthase family protein [Paenibacillus sp. NPDC058071]|uniref:LTA synthase family protein n=1 Tax=Paenibacillus sp. NPDC058071 TaxID=3346326 RepID=UPI0036DCA428